MVLFWRISWFYAVDAVLHIGDGEMIPRGVSRGCVTIMGCRFPTKPFPIELVLWGIGNPIY